MLDLVQYPLFISIMGKSMHVIFFTRKILSKCGHRQIITVTYLLYYMKLIRHLKLNTFKIESNFSDRSIYDKRDDFNFEIVNFPFLDGDVPRSSSYGVYISQLIGFAIVRSNMLVILTIRETSFLTFKL